MREVAKTRKVLTSYLKGGIRGVVNYLSNPDLEIRENTWVYKAKTLIDQKCLLSLEQEIELILYKFNLGNDERDEVNKRGEDS